MVDAFALFGAFGSRLFLGSLVMRITWLKIRPTAATSKHRVVDLSDHLPSDFIALCISSGAAEQQGRRSR